MKNDPYFINKRGNAQSIQKGPAPSNLTQLVNWCAPAIDGCPNCKKKHNNPYKPNEYASPIMNKDGGSGYYRCEEFEFDGNIEPSD